MSNYIESPKSINSTIITKQKDRDSTFQLIFHIPEGMKLSAKVDLDLSRSVEVFAQECAEIVVEAEVPKVLSIQDINEGAFALEAIHMEITPPEVVVVPAIESSIHSKIVDISIQVNDLTDEVIPFFSLELKNAPEVYKVGTFFLKDIANGQKYFGFACMSKKISDIHLLVYASFINYSLKKPVLVIVKDINDKAFDKYRTNFTQGTLWKWKTNDWANLCFVDYSQVRKFSEELKSLDLNSITDEFGSVLWTLGSGDVQDELQNASLNVLRKISSVTFVVCAGETRGDHLKKATAYYQCFDILPKGILIGEK